MSGFFSKLLGLFVERVPVDEQGRPLPKPVPGPKGAHAPQQTQRTGQAQGAPATPGGVPQQHIPPQQPAHPQAHPAHQQQPVPTAPPAGAPPQSVQPNSGMGVPVGASQQPQQPGTPPAGSVAPSPAAPTVAVVLRAIVPQEYAAHLAPYGIHVLAAAADITSEQARGWGAQVLVVSAECLGRELHLLQAPQLPTVFISPQPVMIPEQPGVVQVHEPLHASDVARAVREAGQAWAAAGRTVTR